MRIRELAFLGVLAACGGGDDDGEGGAEANAAPGAPDGCSPAEGDPAMADPNRGGGTFTPGPENAIENTTGLTEQERVLPPHPFGDSNWDAITGCFTTALAPFHI